MLHDITDIKQICIQSIYITIYNNCINYSIIYQIYIPSKNKIINFI